MPKEYRLVVRNTLTDLELGVRALKEDRWDFDRNAESISLLAAFDDSLAGKQIAIAMMREKALLLVDQ
jgi:hypothetical protein